MQRDRSVLCQGCMQTAQDHLGPYWQLSKHSWVYSPQNILGRACFPSSDLLLRVKPLWKEKCFIFSGASLQNPWQTLLSNDHNTAWVYFPEKCIYTLVARRGTALLPIVEYIPIKTTMICNKQSYIVFQVTEIFKPA